MNFKKLSLYPQYSLYFISVIAFVLFISICYIGYVVHSSRQEFNVYLQKDAFEIEQMLRKIFDETSQRMLSLSKEIGNKKDNKEIELLLDKNPTAVYYMGKDTDDGYLIDKSIETIYYGPIQKWPSWRKLFWIPPHNTLMINSELTQKFQSANLSHRTYMTDSRKSPWKLHFSPPTIGFPSGLWEFPAGMGVIDRKGQYLGTLVVGFTIGELNSKLQQKALHHHSSFIVLDTNYKVVLQSPDNSIDLRTSYYQDLLSQSPLSMNYQGSINPIHHNGISYAYYQKVQGYPYVVLTGFKEDLVFKQVMDTVLPRLLEIISMGGFCLILLYSFRSHLLAISRKSKQAKEAFLKEVRDQTNVSLMKISGVDQEILTYLQNIESISLNSDKYLKIKSLIRELNHHCCGFTSNTLNLSYVDVTKIFQEAVLIHTQNALIKHIRFIRHASLKSELPPLYTDELCLKQILVALVGLSLNFTQERGTIRLSLKLEEKENLSQVHIVIEDDGISLDENGVTHLQKTLGLNLSNHTIELNFDVIKKMIVSLGASCFIQPKSDRGKMIKLILPYHSEGANIVLNNSFQDFFNSQFIH